jgi:CubicO group peptidase (beta-lactamase class C family)
MSKLLLLSFFTFFLSACSASDAVVRVTQPDTQPLATAAPADVGMDGALLEQAVKELPPPGEHGMRSMLVLRHGKLVKEVYWNGYDKDAQQDLRSATKSITALLVGIAIDKQIIKGVDEPVRTYLAAAYPQAPALRQDITLEHLLTMRSGLACDDRDPQSPGQEDRMYKERDWVQYFLELPVARAPGVEAHYCTGGAVALGRVVVEAGKQAFPAYADAVLFAPLGIAGARWQDFDQHRQTDTGGHLALRPRDMAKIGQLLLQRGMWNGQQLVSNTWMEQMTREHTLIDKANRSYGYLWWRMDAPYQGKNVQIFYAGGNGGQFIFVVPQLDLVVVFTGGNYNSSKAGRPHQWMKKYILPAVQQTP